MQRSRVMFILAAVGVCGLSGGCVSQDPAVKRSEQAAGVLVSTSESLAVGEQTVVDAQAALRTLGQSKGDLRPPFLVFMQQLAAVRKNAELTRRQSDAVCAQATAYCSARKTDISTIGNDDMRQAAEIRAGRVQEQCNTIKEMYTQLNQSYAAYIHNLSDLQTYLANELNYGALESGKRWVDEALASGERLRGNIRGLALQVDLMSNVLSPVPIATTQWPSPIPPTNAVADRQ